MAFIIIPLAGPDFFTEQFGIRPLYPLHGSTLLEYVLSKRKWMAEPYQGENQLVFVLREVGEATTKMRSFIAEKFPLASTVVLGEVSLGAPFSALAGLALVKNPALPLIIDLADIAFKLSCHPGEYFRSHPQVDALVPYFISQDPKFSYLKIEGSVVMEAREKEVISSHASAGVYCFRDVPTYLKAMSYCFEYPNNCKVGASFFVCPCVNGLIGNEREVHAIQVDHAESIGTIFH